MSEPIVIVGGGHAAAQLCASLAEAGAGPRLQVVCEEPSHPYQRPPLSKSYLKNAQEGLQLHRDVPWYATHGIQVHLGDPARTIDRATRTLTLASGKQVAYGQLVLATGTRARLLPQFAQPLANVITLRSAADAAQLRQCLVAQGGSGELTVLGGGFIGLEVAATARHLGWQVRLLEVAPRLLGRATSPELSAQVLAHHQGLGTQVLLGAQVGDARIADGRVLSLQVNGQDTPVQQLLLGIGAVPEVALAQQAGLAVDNGILVDAAMRSSDPVILAAGDCTSFEYGGRRLRLESVNNASEQAKVAAATLLGQPAAYRPTPTFWSDQGGLRLQMVGLWRAGLQAVRRDGAAAGSFSLFHYDGAQLVAVESANAPMDHMWARKLLEQGVSPTPAQAADASCALKSLL